MELIVKCANISFLDKKLFVFPTLLMNENEIEVCKRIIEALIRRPISSMFWNPVDDLTNSNVVHPFTLSWISDRFSQGKYQNPTDFVRDVRACLQNGKTGWPIGSIRFAAAQQLLTDLDNIIFSLHPGAFPSILPLRFAISDFEKSAGIPGCESLASRTAGKTPASEVFSNSDPNNLITLIRDIKFLTSPDLTAKLAVLVSALRPEAVMIGDDISFNFALMDEDVRGKVREYVTRLLKDAATGKLDPFARPFGAIVNPVRVQERGVCINPN